MIDYIGRDEILEKQTTLHEMQYGTGSRTLVDVPAVRVSDIESIPAADVRPVVRGEWEWSSVDGRCVLACSKCGSIMPTDHALDYIDAEDNHFCYWCGADMRTIGQRLSDISVEEDLFPELTAEEKAENRAEAKRMIEGADV